MGNLAKVALIPSRSEEQTHDPTVRERFEVAKNHLLLARQAAGRGLKPLAYQELLRARLEVDVVLRSLRRARRGFGPRSAKIPRLVKMVDSLGHDLKSTSVDLSSL